MATRNSLTDVRIADGYPSLLIISDDTGIGSTEYLINDGDGTASGLKLGSASSTFTLPLAITDSTTSSSTTTGEV